MKVDNQRAYTIINAKPTADLQRLRYLLLLWGGDGNPRDPSGPSEVYRAANERIMQVMPQVVTPIMAPAPESAPDSAVQPAPVVQPAVQPKPAQPAQPAVPPAAQRAPDAAPADTVPARQLRMKPQ